MQICVNSWILSVQHATSSANGLVVCVHVCVCVFSSSPQPRSQSVPCPGRESSTGKNVLRASIPPTHHNTQLAMVNTGLKAAWNTWTAHFLHSSGAQTKSTDNIFWEGLNWYTWRARISSSSCWVHTFQAVTCLASPAATEALSQIKFRNLHRTQSF